MKINETTSNVLTEGIFITFPLLSWFEETEPLNCNIDYYTRSGFKTITPLFEQILKIEDINSRYETLVSILNQRFEDKWKRLYETFKKEYNPIHNYNMEEKTNTKANFEVTENNSNDVYGFNSISSVPNTEDKTTRQTIANKDDNETTTSRSGNIGVTTTQKMINEEINVRKYILLEEIYKDIDSILTLKIYDIND